MHPCSCHPHRNSTAESNCWPDPGTASQGPIHLVHEFSWWPHSKGARLPKQQWQWRLQWPERCAPTDPKYVKEANRGDKNSTALNTDPKSDLQPPNIHSLWPCKIISECSSSKSPDINKVFFNLGMDAGQHQQTCQYKWNTKHLSKQPSNTISAENRPGDPYPKHWSPNCWPIAPPERGQDCGVSKLCY